MNRQLPAVTVAVWLMGVCPAAAQVDLSGLWSAIYHEDQLERVPGPEVGDYLGLPLTDQARAHAQAWSASLLTLPEHQCKPHPVAYGYRGPAEMRIQQEVDTATQRVVKIAVQIQWMEQYREIWMDGRPHPPEYAPHTWQGFSTGQWEGNTLVVSTTHMKAGWIRRNGVPYSDRARFTDRWTRRGDIISHVAILEDPLNLTEPFVRTTNWRLNPTRVFEPYPCTIVDEIADLKPGAVPHFLPGTNTMLRDFAQKHGLEQAWAEGGAHTAYPEFRRVTRPPAPARPVARADGPAALEVFHVQDKVYLIAGAGTNVVVQVGADGVLIVDSGPAAKSEALLQTIRSLAGGKPIRYIINTSADPEHTGGNEVLSVAGETIAAGDIRNALGDNSGVGAAVIAHESVQRRMVQPAGTQPARAPKAWPTDTFFSAKKELFFNGEGVQILHAPNAHSDGDVMVYFRKSDVLVAGHLFSTDTYPVIRADQGGAIDGVLAALNEIIDTTIPREKQEAGTYIVPGRGRVADEADVVVYRDMITIVRDRVRDLAAKGMTLQQVIAANPTYEYDVRWSGEAQASADAFVERVYNTLRR